MRKLWPAWCLAVWVVIACAGQAWAAETKTPVYLGGERSELQALVVNGASYLPLRELADIFDLDIDWNQAEKRVEVVMLDEHRRLWLERKTVARGYANAEGDISWREEEALDYTPLVREGRVWLPISFFDNLTEAEVIWDEEAKGVSIAGIPIWQNGRWTSTYANGAQTKRDAKGNTWMVFREGEPILGGDYLWWLRPDGDKHRIDQGWMIELTALYDGKCLYKIMKNPLDFGMMYWADGAAGSTEPMGRQDMVYAFKLNREPSYRLWKLEGQGARLRIDEDGVWTTGVAKAAVTDFWIDGGELVRETYGLYRVWPGGHELVEKYELPE